MEAVVPSDLGYFVLLFIPIFFAAFFSLGAEWIIWGLVNIFQGLFNG